MAHLINNLDVREINLALLGLMKEVQGLHAASKTQATTAAALSESVSVVSSTVNSMVSSVFGRTGEVVAKKADYAVDQITGAAPLESPTFSGIPTVPTPEGSDDSLQATNTAWVKGQGFLKQGPDVTLWLVAMNADGSIQVDADGYAALAPSVVVADSRGSIAVDADGFVIPQAVSVPSA